MRMIRVAILGCLTVLAGLSANVIPGDARRGEQLFQSESCVQCHSLNGKGGNTAPDLGKRIDRNYTPTVMASLMWNHAPAMWAAMAGRGIAKPALSQESAADLFAYFYSARFFERPGDAARGKQLFSSRHCSECHGIASSKAAGAKPVSQWQSLGDPVILVQQMWNHVANMREAFAKKKIGWQQITSQELTDILVYLQNLPETRSLATSFSFPPVESGQSLFESKGCIQCHTGKLALENRLRNHTLTDIAVAMWNHAPRMLQMPPALDQEEMRQIVSYVWTKQFLYSSGNAARGKRVFTEKNCAVCHNDPSSGAPNLSAGKGTYSEISMVAALWQHGPGMLERMQQKNLPWPRFTAGQMSDLIAYLNSSQ